mgnify:CR=1 FL=1
MRAERDEQAASNYNRRAGQGHEGKALLEKWGVQGDYIGVGNCILGYVKGEIPAPKARKEDYIVMA